MRMVPFDYADNARTTSARRTFLEMGIVAQEGAASAPEAGHYVMSLLVPGWPNQVLWISLEKWEVGRGWLGPRVRWRMCIELLKGENGEQIAFGYLTERNQPQMWSYFLASLVAICDAKARLLSDEGSIAAMATS